MKLQKLLSYTRQAVDDYGLIKDGDKIAVGISGGKDSLTLLYALSNLQRFYPKKFELIAVTVDLGYNDFDLSEVQNLCEQLQVPYHVIQNPCPADGHTQRESAKQLVRQINLEHPGAKKRIFRAISEGKIDGWEKVSATINEKAGE